MLLSPLQKIFLELSQLFLLLDVLAALLLVDVEDLDVGVDLLHLGAERLDLSVDLWLLVDEEGDFLVLERVVDSRIRDVILVALADDSLRTHLLQLNR